MKSVCMVVMSLYPNDERVRREAMALERAGIAVDVICMRGENESAVEQFGRVTAHRIMRAADKESIVKYLWVSARFTVAAFVKMQTLAWKNDYDAVQAHNMPDYLIFAGIVQKLRRKPLVLDLHDLTVELFEAKWEKKRSKILLPLVRTFERLSCAIADELITTSQGFKNCLVQRGVSSEKITLVLNTPDPGIFRYQPGRVFEPIHEGARLLYHGTVAERFGLTAAIRALARVRERIPNSTLDIYGKYDPSYKETLQCEIERLGLEGQVRLNGWLKPAQVCDAIRDADIGLVPYLDNSFMNLALSTKTFEYAALGLPVVASRLRSITSVFDERSITFAEPDSSESMADRAIELCLSPELRRQRTENALQALDEISGSVMERRYVNLMQTRPWLPKRRTVIARPVSRTAVGSK